VSEPTWTILVPTVAPRAEKFERLLGILLPQLDPYGGRVRVLAYLNHGVPVLGAIRDRLVDTATSDYVSFIDDDDTVVPDFVDRIVAALDSTPSPDHVGFRLEYIVNGVHEQYVDHSLRWPRWGRYDGMLCRDFTHVDPIRREIVATGRFETMRPGWAEDRHWVKQVRGLLRGRIEAYVDDVLYHYRYSPENSMWTRAVANAGIPLGERKPVEHPHFAWHPDSD
jgi:hypothetical protein